MGFYGSPLNPRGLTCGLIIVEATTGKELGKKYPGVVIKAETSGTGEKIHTARYRDNLFS